MTKKFTRSGRFFTLAWIISVVLMTGMSVVGQTVTELVIPKYFGAKTAAAANVARTGFAVCIKIDGLTPATAYDLRPGLGLITEPSTTYGAGNYWNGTTFSGTTSILNAFTTDASGSSGPVWIFLQPTGNSSRFDAGQVHTLRLGWATAGGAIPSAPLFVGTKTLTALDIAVTARTPAVTDDGCFIDGASLAPSNGKYVLLYDNEAGTGDPLFAYMIRPMVPTQSSNTELPAVINDIYMQAGTSVNGDYPAVVPIGANNPAGVRRVESRDASNTVFAFNTSPNGIWPSGANTTTTIRRDVVALTDSDTPLTPSGPGYPVVTTNTAVTNITFNTATGGGNVTGNGGVAITARGLCWGTAANPTIAGTHSVEPGGMGAFTSNMTGLQPSTTYHVRAYATNSTGTSYGANVTFTTLCEIMAPLPDFSASKINIMVGESINFFDSTQFCPTSWDWSFVGGTPSTSTQQNPTGITYNVIGDYTVCLTATNEWGQQTACKTAYIHVAGPTNAPLVITEINYRSPIGGTDSLEFIELYNNSSTSIDLHNFYFSRGIEFTFPAVTLNPHSWVMVGKSSVYMSNIYGVTGYQWNTGSALTNQGEAIVIKDNYGFVVDSVYYLPGFPWDTLANGHGPSLQLCDPNANNTLPQNWRTAVEFAGFTPAGDSLFASPLAGCSYLPVAAFTVSDSTLTLGQSVVFTDLSSGDVTSWFWEFERGVPETFSGQNPPPVQYNILGTYDVKLTVTNAIGQNKKYKPGYIQVGPSRIASPDENNLFTLIPNPVREGRFRLDLGYPSDYAYTIRSLQGMEVLRDKHLAVKKIEIECPALPAGCYFIQVTDLKNGKSSTQKFINY